MNYSRHVDFHQTDGDVHEYTADNELCEPPGAVGRAGSGEFNWKMSDMSPCTGLMYLCRCFWATLTDYSNNGDDREAEEHDAVSKSLDARPGKQTSDELADEGQRRYQRGMSRGERVLVRFGVIVSELIDESLKTYIVRAGRKERPHPGLPLKARLANDQVNSSRCLRECHRSWQCRNRRACRQRADKSRRKRATGSPWTTPIGLGWPSWRKKSSKLDAPDEDNVNLIKQEDCNSRSPDLEKQTSGWSVRGNWRLVVYLI